jgi:hypothetical protein
MRMSNNTAANLDKNDVGLVHYLIQDGLTGEFLVAHEDDEFGGDQWAQLDVDAEDIGSASYLEEEVDPGALFSSPSEALEVAQVLMEVLKERFPGEEVDLQIVKTRTVTTSFIETEEVDFLSFTPDVPDDSDEDEDECCSDVCDDSCADGNALNDDEVDSEPPRRERSKKPSSKKRR